MIYQENPRWRSSESVFHFVDRGFLTLSKQHTPVSHAITWNKTKRFTSRYNARKD